MACFASQSLAAEFDQRTEHGLEIEGRAADDLEHVGGRGLLLERLGKIVGALPQLIEQPRILYGDDGLRREVRDQLDLLVSKRADFFAKNADGTDQLSIFQQGDVEQRADAAEIGRCAAPGIALGVDLLGAGIDDVHRLFGFDDPAEPGVWAGEYRPALKVFGEFARDADLGKGGIGAVLITKQSADAGTAHAGCVLQDGLEHRREIAGRA